MSRAPLAAAVTLAALILAPGTAAAQPVTAISMSDRHLVLSDARVAGANLTAIRTSEGIVLIDALGSPAAGDEARFLIAQAWDEPIRHLVLTHPHGDHVWGAEAFPEATVHSHELARERIPADPIEWDLTVREQLGVVEDSLEWARANGASGQRIQRFERRRLWLEAELELLAGLDPVEPDSLVRDRSLLVSGDTRFEILALPGHTDADLVVLVSEASLLATGDHIFAGQAPCLASTAAGSLATAIEIHERLFELAASVRYVVPGHGQVGDASLVQDRLLYLIDLRNAVQSTIEGRATFDESRDALLLDHHRSLTAFAECHPANLEIAWAELGG